MVENIRQSNAANVASSSLPGVPSASSSVPRGTDAPKVEKSPTQVAQEQVKELRENKNVEELKKDLMELTEQLNKEFNPLNTKVSM